MPIQLTERVIYQERTLESLARSLNKKIAQIWINPVTGELALRGNDRVDRKFADLGFDSDSFNKSE